MHYARGDCGEALGWYEKSVALAEELGDRAGLATTLHNRGYVALATKDLPLALELFTRSREVSAAIGGELAIRPTWPWLFGPMAHHAPVGPAVRRDIGPPGGAGTALLRGHVSRQVSTTSDWSELRHALYRVQYGVAAAAYRLGLRTGRDGQRQTTEASEVIARNVL